MGCQVAKVDETEEVAVSVVPDNDTVLVMFLSRAAFGFTALDATRMFRQIYYLNLKSRIVGNIWYVNDIFITTMIGTREAIERCLKRVADDRRHTDILCLASTVVRRTMIPSSFSCSSVAAICTPEDAESITISFELLELGCRTAYMMLPFKALPQVCDFDVEKPVMELFECYCVCFKLTFCSYSMGNATKASPTAVEYDLLRQDARFESFTSLFIDLMQFCEVYFRLPHPQDNCARPLQSESRGIFVDTMSTAGSKLILTIRKSSHSANGIVRATIAVLERMNLLLTTRTDDMPFNFVDPVDPLQLLVFTCSAGLASGPAYASAVQNASGPTQTSMYTVLTQASAEASAISSLAFHLCYPLLISPEIAAATIPEFDLFRTDNDLFLYRRVTKPRDVCSRLGCAGTATGNCYSKRLQHYMEHLDQNGDFTPSVWNGAVSPTDWGSNLPSSTLDSAIAMASYGSYDANALKTDSADLALAGLSMYAHPRYHSSLRRNSADSNSPPDGSTLQAPMRRNLRGNSADALSDASSSNNTTNDRVFLHEKYSKHTSAATSADTGDSVFVHLLPPRPKHSRTHSASDISRGVTPFVPVLPPDKNPTRASSPVEGSAITGAVFTPPQSPPSLAPLSLETLCSSNVSNGDGSSACDTCDKPLGTSPLLALALRRKQRVPRADTDQEDAWRMAMTAILKEPSEYMERFIQSVVNRSSRESPLLGWSTSFPWGAVVCLLGRDSAVMNMLQDVWPHHILIYSSKVSPPEETLPPFSLHRCTTAALHKCFYDILSAFSYALNFLPGLSRLSVWRGRLLPPRGCILDCVVYALHFRVIIDSEVVSQLRSAKSCGKPLSYPFQDDLASKTMFQAQRDAMLHALQYLQQPRLAYTVVASCDWEGDTILVICPLMHCASFTQSMWSFSSTFPFKSSAPPEAYQQVLHRMVVDEKIGSAAHSWVNSYSTTTSPLRVTMKVGMHHSTGLLLPDHLKRASVVGTSVDELLSTVRSERVISRLIAKKCAQWDTCRCVRNSHTLAWKSVPPTVNIPVASYLRLTSPGDL